ncbi:hypothetical protein ERAQ111492_05490 [Erysipelothrix aquatica]|uniref:YobI family P-loop NTPase n=3 Tax=Erysipelothrix aquatica TaxID=2683714 RepID=UPI00135BCD43|nr:hypothetical protein [Erysipelothrix aquatica]
MDHKKFVSLTPEVLNKNEKVYNDALDEAFGNENIKNIAITGIYGSGKSSVWETYRQKKKFENVISISLGKYDDSFYENNVKKNDSDEDEIDTKVSENLNLENNIERQLINQIVAQVDNKKIPLSKYRYLENKSSMQSIFDVVLIFAFLLSLLFWNYRNRIIPFFGNYVALFLFLILIMFLFPIACFLFGIIKSRRMPFAKIKFGSAEASFNEELNKDETVLDRDIRELVYILYNSNSDVVVFEDLDRYNHLDIYKKLRELNYLLNSFISSNKDEPRKKKTNEDNRVVRFVYLLKDGLFYSKNRTKFFDFIVPIIPVVNSKNSEDKLLELFNENENAPSNKAIFNISLYIDDMRLIKNIFNEYNIYHEIIPVKELELSKDKLLSLIVLKNVFPKEFDDLQQDCGYICTFIKNKENIKNTLIDQLSSKLEKNEEKIKYLEERMENSKYEFIASHIPTNIWLKSDGIHFWPEKLKELYDNPQTKINVYYLDNIGRTSVTGELDIEEFLEKYIYLDDDIRKKVVEFPENRIKELELLKERKATIQMEIRDISILSISNLLKKLEVDQRDKQYLETDNPITESHYFPLIKYLLNEGLIDETYWHYKGYFYENSLGKNDTLFLKNILEGSNQDLFMKLENSELVFERMVDEDFLRNNIFNSDVIEVTIVNESKDRINNILLSAVRTNQMEDLSNIFLNFKDSNKMELLQTFVVSIFDKNYKSLYIFMKFVETNNEKIFNRMIFSLFSQKNLSDGIALFKELIENHSEVLILLKNDSESFFLKNLTDNDIKFLTLENVEVDLDIITEIASNNLFKLSVQNVYYIVNELSQKKIEASCLLQTVLEEQKLTSIKDRMESNFVTFTAEYIDYFRDIRFNNNEQTVLRILSSSLEDSYKIAYLDRNNTTINTLSNFKNTKEQIQLGIVDKLFETNRLLYSINNIESYLENEGRISEDFLDYLEFHTRKESVSKDLEDSVISQSNELSNMILGRGEISDALFSRAVIGASEPLSKIEGNYSESRIMELIHNDLFGMNGSVFRYILDNNYSSALALIYNKGTSNISEVLPSNSEYYNMLNTTDIYTLINQVDSQEDILKLLKKVEFELDLSKIDLGKDEIVGFALQHNLQNNLSYILSNFKDFNFKDLFLIRLQEKTNFEGIEFNLLNDEFITFVIKTPIVTERNKVSLINKAIKESTRAEDFIKYLDVFEELDNLGEVFNGKHPKVDTELKREIANKLKEEGYVKDRGKDRIMLK